MTVEHKVRTVTRTQHCKIDNCTCGAVHISVGSVTMRIKAGAARELRDALVRAMAEIDTQTTTADGVPKLGGPFRLVLPDTPVPKKSDDDGEGGGGPQVH